MGNFMSSIRFAISRLAFASPSALPSALLVIHWPCGIVENPVQIIGARVVLHFYHGLSAVFGSGLGAKEPFPSLRDGPLRYDTSSGSVFPVADSVYVQGTAIANPKGLKTRERVAMIDGTVVSSAVSYLERYYWYDSSGRVAQCYEEFPDGETLRTSYRYGIQGNVLKTMQTCTKDNTSVWTVSTYRYDHRGRLASVSRSFSETSHLDDITYGYDVLGHPASRSCGGKISETQTYDIRGWNECLTASRGSNVLFGETLRYSSPESSQSEGQHNGNITEITSSHYGMARETVSYFYDNLNRLRDAKHYTGSLSNPDNNYTERDITYDRNGNILSMTRSQTSPQDITMTYIGNRLASYCDSEQFIYDSNGNCCFDPTTGLEYSCNFLNLPCTVFDGEEMQLQYTYFADGTKYSVMRDFNEGYVYVGPFVYKIHPDYDYPFLESVSSEEGRLVCDESSHIWRDCWFTKDHIGNVRTVLDLSKSASAPLSDIIVEQDSYLPFGTKSANPALFGSDNRYRLAGKEEQHLFDFTTTLTDFGARSYNPTICRWMTIDPLAEKYHGTSPYNYCGNNPVNMVDHLGMQPVKYIDSSGDKRISWSVVIMVKAPKNGATAKMMNRHEIYKQSLADNYSRQFNHYLNGDGEGALNSSNERVFSTFSIKVIDVQDPSDLTAANELSTEYGQDIEEGQIGMKGNAAVFMDGGTDGAYGKTRRASFITISHSAPDGTESHELFHTTGVGDNGYKSGGVLNSPPEPIKPEEVDQMWNSIPMKK